jgi:hypothetical protein
MKKMGSLIQVVYNIIMVKVHLKKVTHKTISGFKNKNGVDDELRKLITSDRIPFEENKAIQELLADRVRKNTGKEQVFYNSFSELFMSLFSLRFFELKMALVGLVFVLSLNIGSDSANNSKGVFSSDGSKVILCDTFPHQFLLKTDSIFQ